MEAEESLIAESAENAESAERDTESSDTGEAPADQGERPEWLKEKYKSVEDQAKAYGELESKFGGFTGAPDGDYELTLPEGVEGEFDLEDPRLSWFQETAKQAGMNQETFSSMLHGFIQSEIEGQPNQEAELKALGDNAQARLKTLGEWGRANLSEEVFEKFRGVATTAEGVEALEAIISHTREAKIPRENTAQPSGFTPEALRQMRYAKDDSGQLRINTDPDYRKKVDRAYKELYGEAPLNQVAG